MTEYIPYTYLIGWSWLNKWYYGAEYKNNKWNHKKANPSNLWTSYFTSSDQVQKCRNFYGEPDVIMVRKIFENEKICREWEHKVLDRLNVKIKDKWLNIANGSGHTSGMKGRQHTQKTKLKISQASIGKPKTKQHIQNSSNARRGLKLGPCSEERKRKISLANTGKKRSEKTKKIMSELKIGIKYPNRKLPIPCSPEHRLHLSIASKNAWIERKES